MSSEQENTGRVFLSDEPIGFEEEMPGGLMAWGISVAFLAGNLKESAGTSSECKLTCV